MANGSNNGFNPPPALRDEFYALEDFKKRFQKCVLPPRDLKGLQAAVELVLSDLKKERSLRGLQKLNGPDLAEDD